MEFTSKVTEEMICKLKEKRDPFYKKVKSHMGWSDNKTEMWFATPNPIFGNIAPNYYVAIDRIGKLEKVINNLIEETVNVSEKI